MSTRIQVSKWPLPLTLKINRLLPLSISSVDNASDVWMDVLKDGQWHTINHPSTTGVIKYCLQIYLLTLKIRVKWLENNKTCMWINKWKCVYLLIRKFFKVEKTNKWPALINVLGYQIPVLKTVLLFPILKIIDPYPKYLGISSKSRGGFIYIQAYSLGYARGAGSVKDSYNTCPGFKTLLVRYIPSFWLTTTITAS